MGVSFFMAFRKPVQPAVTGFMLWFSGHFSWCLMAHLPSNPVFIRVSGNVTVRRTQSHARKYTLFFPSVKVPAAIRVHSAMTFSAKFLNFPDISKKFFTETYPLISALCGGIFCSHTAKQYIDLLYLRIFRIKRQKKKALHNVCFNISGYCKIIFHRAICCPEHTATQFPPYLSCLLPEKKQAQEVSDA